MTLQGDVLICDQPGCDVSAHMTARLVAVYEGGEPPRPTNVRPGFPGWGGRWFCPGDGARAVEQDGVVSCPTCERPMNEFLYPLIEFHGPHPA